MAAPVVQAAAAAKQAHPHSASLRLIHNFFVISISIFYALTNVHQRRPSTAVKYKYTYSKCYSNHRLLFVVSIVDAYAMLVSGDHFDM